MKNIIILLLVLVPAIYVSGQQKLLSNDARIIKVKEDSLSVLADSMINGKQAGKRFRADSQFVKTLVRALQIKNSFQHPFDSVISISRLYAPDSSFRIFTWQLKRDEYIYFQRGAIQMNTNDGNLKLFPLFDVSMFSGKLNDSVRTRKNWVGAIYYNIIQKEYEGKQYYTLLGFDGYTVNANRKWMEVLSFNEITGEPVFGGSLISYKSDSATHNVVLNRFSIEYKKEASTTFNYSKDLDLIIFDHLISESEEPLRKETYIPDGDFEGFQWKNGKWVHIEKVFNEIPDEFKQVDPYLGNAPIDDAVRDKDGNVNEKKLEERSRKNIEKAKEKPKQKN